MMYSSEEEIPLNPLDNQPDGREHHRCIPRKAKGDKEDDEPDEEDE